MNTRSKQRLARARAGESRSMPARNQRAREFARKVAAGASLAAAASAVGYAPTSAKHAGMELSARGDVQDAVAQLRLDADLKTSFTVAELVDAIAEIAFFDPGEFFGPEQLTKAGAYQCKLSHIKALPLRARRVIASMRVVRRNLTAGDGITDEVVEVKWWNKIDALRLLAEHKGLLVQRLEIDVTVQAAKLAKLDDGTLAAEAAALADAIARDALDRAQLRSSRRALDAALDQALDATPAPAPLAAALAALDADQLPPLAATHARSIKDRTRTTPASTPTPDPSLTPPPPAKRDRRRGAKLAR